MDKKAILLGASGLIGTHLLSLLLNSSTYDQVLILVRKELNIQHPKLRQLIVDFELLNQYAHEIKGDVVFCCLGTTKSKTPDPAQYRKIDLQYPVDVAWMAQSNGAEQYHLISALGANRNSSIFYSKLKGEAEHEIKAVPFKAIHIYQPSLLDGDRKESRSGEHTMIRIMHILNPLLIGPLKKYRSIQVSKVAMAMFRKSTEEHKGIYTYTSEEIDAIGS